jgi:hypothetical protein
MMMLEERSITKFNLVKEAELAVKTSLLDIEKPVVGDLEEPTTTDLSHCNSGGVEHAPAV